MKIAEALVMRKHLAEKVEQLKPLKLGGDQGLFEVRTERKNVSESTDEVSFQIPKVTLKEVTKEYDMYSKALRELDTAIQSANWQYDVKITLDKEISV